MGSKRQGSERRGGCTWYGEHGEDGGVGVVKGHRVHGAEAAEVVLVGRVVAVPGDHVERGEVLPGKGGY